VGTWGSGVLDNDFSTDVYATYESAIRDGASHSAARGIVEKELLAECVDTEDVANFWLGLAAVQWEHKTLDTDVYKKAQAVYESFCSPVSGIDEPFRLAKRKTLESFIKKLGEPSRGRRTKRKRASAPRYPVGACLAIRLRDDMWGACIVFGVSDREPYHYLLAALDYRSNEMPTSEVYEAKTWIWWDRANQRRAMLARRQAVLDIDDRENPWFESSFSALANQPYFEAVRASSVDECEEVICAGMTEIRDSYARVPEDPFILVGVTVNDLKGFSSRLGSEHGGVVVASY